MLQEKTPSFQLQRRETVPQAACLTVHLSASTPAEDFRSVLWTVFRGSCDELFPLRCSCLLFFLPLILPLWVVHTVNLSCQMTCFFISINLPISRLLLYSPRVLLYINFSSFCSSLPSFSINNIFLQVGFCFSLSFSLSLWTYIYLYISVAPCLPLLTYCKRSKWANLIGPQFRDGLEHLRKVGGVHNSQTSNSSLSFSPLSPLLILLCVEFWF